MFTLIIYLQFPEESKSNKNKNKNIHAFAFAYIIKASSHYRSPISTALSSTPTLDKKCFQSGNGELARTA
jgi:hypothetical protein